MSFKTELLNKLITAAEKPENEFDRMISDNKTVLEKLDERRLSDIYTLRRKAERLCRQIPFSREEIKMLTESGEVSPYGLTAELENCFEAADYIFSKANGKNF